MSRWVACKIRFLAHSLLHISLHSVSTAHRLISSIQLPNVQHHPNRCSIFTYSKLQKYLLTLRSVHDRWPFCEVCFWIVSTILMQPRWGLLSVLLRIAIKPFGFQASSWSWSFSFHSVPIADLHSIKMFITSFFASSNAHSSVVFGLGVHINF